MINKNPWLGLASYEEPKNDGTDYQFCGRDEETIEMVRLIDNNLFITLYGSSGIGKTSLLRAGVIPILRRKDYFPLYVRLSQEPKEIPYAEAIVRKLQSNGLTEEKGVEMKHPDAGNRLFLWEYFATTRFLNEGREVYPVIILDQFEEVFREGDKAKAELLLRQIYLLLNDELEMPDRAGWSADTNYRFVASIREDFLFVLEDSIDENSLDLYKNNRYRLRPMKPEQARQVVLVPGKDCIEETEKEIVTERIIGLAKRPQSNDIDTLLLSLVCSGTYDKKSGERIVPADLAVWKDNPMEVYYQDAVKGLKADQVRYIQQHFIREDGSRRRVDSNEVKSAFGETTYRELTQGANRLFAIGDKGQVELLHDQLGMAVYEERKAFEERERKKELRRRIMLVGITVMAITGFFFFQNYKLQEIYWKMMENQARAVSEKASQLVDEGDSYLARLLAVEVLPINIKYPDKPYTPEAESVLRKACMDNGAIFRGHINEVTTIAFSPDDKFIASGSKDKTIKIWEVEIGHCVDTLVGHTEGVDCIVYSKDGTHLTSSAGETVCTWELANGECIYKSDHGKITKEAAWHSSSKIIEQIDSIESIIDYNCISVNPKGDVLVVITKKEEAQIWNLKEGKLLKTLYGSWRNRIPPVFSDDGALLAMSDRYGSIVVFDAREWQRLNEKQPDDLRYQFVQASFSHDKRLLALACTDGSIRLWNWNNKGHISEYMGADTLLFKTSDQKDYDYAISPDGKYKAMIGNDSIRIIANCDSTCIKTIVGNKKSLFRTIEFCPDGNLLATTSEDTLRIWDVQSGKCIKTIHDNKFVFYCVQFSSDGKRLVSFSGNFGTIRVWDVSTGYCVFRMQDVPDTYEVYFGDNDRKIIFKSYGKIKAIDFPPLQELIDETRERFKNRPLTPEEQRKYYIEKRQQKVLDYQITSTHRNPI